MSEGSQEPKNCSKFRYNPKNRSKISGKPKNRRKKRRFPSNDECLAKDNKLNWESFCSLGPQVDRFEVWVTSYSVNETRWTQSNEFVPRTPRFLITSPWNLVSYILWISSIMAYHLTYIWQIILHLERHALILYGLLISFSSLRVKSFVYVDVQTEMRRVVLL